MPTMTQNHLEGLFLSPEEVEKALKGMAQAFLGLQTSFEEVGASFSAFGTWLRLENLRIQLENELTQAQPAPRKRL